MSSVESDRRGLWRALLHRALKRGDLLGASRAFDHLRVAGAALTREEAEAAHAARVAVGHAIRDARWRQERDVLYGIPVGGVTVLPGLRSHQALFSPRLLAAALGGLALIAFVLLWRPSGAGLSTPELAPAAPAAATAVAALSGRGRTEATPAPVALPVVTIAPKPTLFTGPVGNGSAADKERDSGDGGSVLPALPNDWDRLIFKVIDNNNGQPLANVCVIYGTPDCGPSRPRTNASGLWWIDFPRSEALSRTWDVGFQISGFDPQRVSVAYVPGAPNVKEIRMVRAR